MRFPILLGFVAAASSAACGAQNVQLYDGDKLPADQVTFLFSNPRLEMGIDRQHVVPAKGKPQRMELPAGHHVMEVRCLYTDDVPWHAADGDGPAPAADPASAKLVASPVITVTMDGEPGKSYKPRAHHTRNAKGVPGCRVRVFDVTDGGPGEDLF